MQSDLSRNDDQHFNGGATLDLETAMQVAQGMAMNEGSVVLIEPLRDQNSPINQEITPSFTR